jgi:hypothetical protein
MCIATAALAAGAWMQKKPATAMAVTKLNLSNFMMGSSCPRNLERSGRLRKRRYDCHLRTKQENRMLGQQCPDHSPNLNLSIARCDPRPCIPERMTQPSRTRRII